MTHIKVKEREIGVSCFGMFTRKWYQLLVVNSNYVVYVRNFSILSNGITEKHANES